MAYRLTVTLINTGAYFPVLCTRSGLHAGERLVLVARWDNAQFENHPLRRSLPIDGSRADNQCRSRSIGYTL